jgi:Fe(3+) dicitrate transport protein
MKFTSILIDILLFLFLGTSSILAATLSGTIVAGESGQPLPYAAISVNEKAGVYSDQNGKFRLDGLEPGKVSLRVSYLGYAEFLKEVELASAAAVIDLGTLVLVEKATAIREVLITFPLTNFNGGYQGSNQIIPVGQLRQMQALGTEEALKTLPGINISGDMGISNRLNVGIRGSYPRRSDKILIMEDGSPVAPAPYLAPSAYYNPPTDRLDGIEVLKGADILAYGANTMYGAINYITKRPPAQPVLNVDIRGGNNAYHSEMITYGGTWKNTGVELQLLNKGFGGFQDNTGSHIFNTTAKVFSELGERQSVYIKLNYHQENSKATYSGLTPFSFEADPRQNPWDADDLLSSRLAADLIHSISLSDRLLLNSKVYAHQFQRDWWRQNTSLKQASEVRDYVGEEIFRERYAYLEGIETAADDYVRVGRISNGRESTKARNRAFEVWGIQESLKFDWGSGDWKNKLEASLKFHSEKFLNQEIANDSSRFARSGRIVLDEAYRLTATSVYVKHAFAWRKLQLVPTVRFEYIRMNERDLLAVAADPANTGEADFGRISNSFYAFVPGISLNYSVLDTEKNGLTLFGGVYKGYTPPTSEVGFLVVSEDGVAPPLPEEPVNMRPETSVNFEAGLRGFLKGNVLNGQIVYFNNNVRNFYAAGRQEAFQTLGSVSINGIEAGLVFDPFRWMAGSAHSLKISTSLTWLHSRITGGQLSDSDLLKAKHTDAGKAEVIQKINSERSGFEVYFAGDSLISRDLELADFDQISRMEMDFGAGGIEDNRAPYTPEYIVNFGLTYAFNGLSVGMNFNRVAAQYTEYLNIENETAEGAIGMLPAFHTLDANFSYELRPQNITLLKGITFYAAAKNLTGEIFRASRLHRVSSGIMPGGFRQFIGGANFSF